jgi:hypothetical protein
MRREETPTEPAELRWQDPLRTANAATELNDADLETVVGGMQKGWNVDTPAGGASKSFGIL